jgi:hypothetical protein
MPTASAMNTTNGIAPNPPLRDSPFLRLWYRDKHPYSEASDLASRRTGCRRSSTRWFLSCPAPIGPFSGPGGVPRHGRRCAGLVRRGYGSHHLRIGCLPCRRAAYLPGTNPYDKRRNGTLRGHVLTLRGPKGNLASETRPKTARIMQDVASRFAARSRRSPSL